MGGLNWRFSCDVRDDEIEDEIGAVGLCGCYACERLSE